MLMKKCGCFKVGFSGTGDKQITEHVLSIKIYSQARLACSTFYRFSMFSTLSKSHPNYLLSLNQKDSMVLLQKENAMG